MNSKKKHIVLILLLILIAVVSVRYMSEQNHGKLKCRITIVLPRNVQENLNSVQEGIRDYAYNNQIQLDVWYEEEMSEKELADLVKDEKKNRSVGVLLVYPEFYLEKKQYHYDEILALTDTMQESFKHYATFAPREKETYRMPVSETVLEQIKKGQKEAVYMENTYRLGYECMQMIETCRKKNSMENICLYPVRIDRETIENGSLDALLAK